MKIEDVLARTGGELRYVEQIREILVDVVGFGEYGAEAFAIERAYRKCDEAEMAKSLESMAQKSSDRELAKRVHALFSTGISAGTVTLELHENAIKENRI